MLALFFILFWRLLFLHHGTCHVQASSVDVDQPMFQPYPSEIVFQNYTASESYEIPLILRNNDKVGLLMHQAHGTGMCAYVCACTCVSF